MAWTPPEGAILEEDAVLPAEGAAPAWAPPAGAVEVPHDSVPDSERASLADDGFREFRRQQLIETRRRNAAEAISSLPAIIREPLHVAAGQGASLMSLATRPFSKDMGDYFSDQGQEIETRAAATRKDDWSPWLSRQYAGILNSAMQAGIASPAGPLGMIGSFGVTEGNEALREAERHGLSGNDRLKYAATQGAIEAGIAAAFQLLPGAGKIFHEAGGMESLVGNLSKGVMATGKETLKAMGWELTEEELTELSHAFAEMKFDVNPQAMDWDQLGPRLFETAVQTFGQFGLLHATTKLAQAVDTVGGQPTAPAGGPAQQDESLGAEVARRGPSGPTPAPAAAPTQTAQEQLAKLNAILAKGYVAAEDGIEGPTRRERWANAVAKKQQLEQEIKDAEAAKGEVRDEQGPAGEVEVPKPGEVTPAPEVQVEPPAPTGGMLGGMGGAIVDNFYKAIQDSLEATGEVPGPERNSSIGRAWENAKGSMSPEEFVRRLRLVNDMNATVKPKGEVAPPPQIDPLADATFAPSPADAEAPPTTDPAAGSTGQRDTLVDKYGQPLGPEVIQAREDFISKATPGATFKHSVYPTEEFIVNPDGRIQTKQGRKLGTGIVEDIAGQFGHQGPKGPPVPTITWTTPEATAEPATTPGGERGVMLAAGETATTRSGRQTTPFPKVDVTSERKTGNTVKRVDKWLWENAVEEARSRGDSFVLQQFEGEDPARLPPATKDSMNEYLFGETLPAPATPEPATTPETPTEADTPPPLEKRGRKQPKAAPAKGRQGKQSLVNAVRQLGGLSSAAVRKERNIKQDFSEFGLLSTFQNTQGQPGRFGLDELAQELQDSGIWKPSDPNANPSDALLADLQKQNLTTAGYNQESFDEEYRRYIDAEIAKEIEDAQADDIQRGEIEEAQRIGEGEGYREIRAREEAEAPEERLTTAEMEALATDDDVSFPFGAEGVPGQQQALFNVASPKRTGKKESASGQPSTLEKIDDELKASRLEPLPGQKTIEVEDAGEGSKTKLQQAADKATKEAFDELNALGKKLKDKGLGLNPFLDPDIVSSVANVTYKFAKAGTLKFAAFLEQLATVIGQKKVDYLRPALEAEWNKLRATGEFSGMDAAEPPEKAPAAPVRIPAGDSPLTSIKNAVVNEIRERRGVGPLPEVTAETRQEWLDVAAERIAASNGTLGPSLVAEISKNPRNFTNIEVAVMQLHYRAVNNAFEDAAATLFAATESDDPTVVATAQQNADRLMGELAAIEDATKAAGREWGRAGVARQITLAKDFSLAGMVRKARVANNGNPLSADQTAEITRMAKQIESLDAELKESEAKRADLERKQRADKSIAEDVKDVKQKKLTKSARRQKAEAAIDAAWAEFSQAATDKLFANPLDPDLIVPAVKVLKAYIDLGAVSFSDAMARLAGKFGKDKADKARATFQAAWNKLKADGEIPVPELDQANVGAVTRLARQLQRAAVESGVTEREPVVDIVHEALQEFIPELTRREAMDAMSGYGQFAPLLKDEISRAIRDINGQLQQLAKLDDMQQGRAPEKTGFERREPSDEERRLIQQVNEAKKRGGFRVTDPEAQLKTALDAAKRATRNRIADLSFEIQNRERIVRTRTELKPDAELQSLRQQRDELREEHKKLFPPPGATEAQKIAAAGRALDRMIGQLEQQVASGDVGFKAKGQPLSAPELTAKRARLESLRADRDALRVTMGLAEQRKIETASRTLDRTIAQLEQQVASGDVAFNSKRPTLSTPELDAKRERLNALREERDALRAKLGLMEERSRKLYEANLKRRLADYQQRIADKDFQEKPKKEARLLSREELNLKRQLEDIRSDFFQKLADYRLSQLTGWDRVLDYARETAHLSRSLIASIDLSAVLRQGAIVVFGHPVMGLKAGRTMLSAIASRQAEFDSVEEIRNRPNAQLYETARLSITDQEGKITRQEEAFMGRWGKKIGPVRVSSRAYTTFLNNLRADLFDALVENLGKSGAVTLDEAKVIAKFVNISTGRADLGKFNGAAANLNTVFFAPRWVASRFQYLALPFQLPFMKTSGRVKAQVATEYARFAIGLGTVLGTILTLGALLTDDDDDRPTIERDPRSSDFGKIKIGETRLDFLAGISQTTVFLARLASGQRKNEAGEIRPLRGEGRKYGEPSVADVILRFGWSKLAPIPGAVVNVLVGENVVGEKTTPIGAAADLFVPLSFRDVKDTMVSRGIPEGIAISTLAILGMGTATYGPRTEYLTGTPEQRETQVGRDLKRMKWNSPDPAYSEFLAQDQRDRFAKRRDERRVTVIKSGTGLQPERDNYRSDESFEEGVAEHERAVNRLRAFAKEVPLAEAEQLLKDSFRDEATGRPKLTASFYEKRKALRRLYAE